MAGKEIKTASVQPNLAKAYPEIGAGGFSRVDGTVEFYNRIQALISPEMRVLDLGAGRGQQIHEARTPYLRNLLTLRGKVAHLAGADVDPVVLGNPFLDEAKVINPGEPLPFEDASFDLIFADWVLEHVEDAEVFASEIKRIMRPNGWFCARTPNRWGITGIATNLIPSRHHAAIVEKLQPGREEMDVFPTMYNLNTKGKLSKFFKPENWEHYSYLYNAEPPYVQRSMIALRVVQTLFRLAPSFFATNFFVFMRKR